VSDDELLDTPTKTLAAACRECWPDYPEVHERLMALRTRIIPSGELLAGAPPGSLDRRWCCPMCGPDPRMDEDGCCAECGATCFAAVWLRKWFPAATSAPATPQWDVEKLRRALHFEFVDSQDCIAVETEAIHRRIDDALSRYFAQPLAADGEGGKK
jgi:hypothetical protein